MAMKAHRSAMMRLMTKRLQYKTELQSMLPGESRETMRRHPHSVTVSWRMHKAFDIHWGTLPNFNLSETLPPIVGLKLYTMGALPGGGHHSCTDKPAPFAHSYAAEIVLPKIQRHKMAQKAPIGRQAYSIIERFCGLRGSLCFRPAMRGCVFKTYGCKIASCSENCRRKLREAGHMFSCPVNRLFPHAAHTLL